MNTEIVSREVDAMFRVVIVLLTLVVSLGVVGRAQSPAPSGATQQPGVTFKADVNFVEIHAVVTDERGNVVKDLAKDDFEVFEDGKPQTPSVFSLVDLPIERPLASYADATGRTGRPVDHAQL